ncbi:hypothetical protein G6011_08537 [Alternaria panax]|uniref:Uncharacterized protein n=1 Tax=Alternaria panax TaxID=48097 RepID=A0AAD4FH43_9PLEO|nr:hypothetical protein G6011_08537 [Alternaria panax]
MRLLAWIQATFHVFDVASASTSVASSNDTLKELEFPETDRFNADCQHNPYCSFTESVGELGSHNWTNDCPGLPRITEKLSRDHKHIDTNLLRKNFRIYKTLQGSKYKLDSDELTFPTYMAKRYAPNVPPSSMLCDGLGMCRVIPKLQGYRY